MRSTTLALTFFAAGAAVVVRADDTIRATTTLHPDGSKTVTVSDPEKGTSEELTQDAAGKLLKKTTYLLDEKSQPIGSITSDAKGIVLYRAAYVLIPLVVPNKPNGYLIKEETISNPQGALIRKRVYTYSAQNKVTGVDEYDANGVKVTKRGNPNARATPSRVLPPRR